MITYKAPLRDMRFLLNEVLDFQKHYASLPGGSDADVDTVFAPELSGLKREEIRHWYNGYNWTGTSVYNPFDLLLLFRSRVFRPYWFETGTPTFLVDLLRTRQAWLPELGWAHELAGHLHAEAAAATASASAATRASTIPLVVSRPST